MREGTIGKSFPIVGKPGGAPRQNGVSGSVKGDAAKVAEIAKVSKPTARKAIRKAAGQATPKPKPEPPPPLSAVALGWAAPKLDALSERMTEIAKQLEAAAPDRHVLDGPLMAPSK